MKFHELFYQDEKKHYININDPINPKLSELSTKYKHVGCVSMVVTMAIRDKAPLRSCD